MATKKRAKAATKRSAKKKPSQKPTPSNQQLEQIPPIIVGGGGSTRVWLRTDYRLLANTPNPPGHYPASAFDCFHFDNNVSRLDVDDGDGGQHPVPVRGRHKSIFK